MERFGVDLNMAKGDKIVLFSKIPEQLLLSMKF
jgi:hypothetical protein